MHEVMEGQVKRLDGGTAVGHDKFVESLFGVAAWSLASHGLRCHKAILATQPSRGRYALPSRKAASAASHLCAGEALTSLKRSSGEVTSTAPVTSLSASR